MTDEVVGWSEFYKNHKLLACEEKIYWILFVQIAPYTSVRCGRYFSSPENAIAHGKAQIDILLSKSLNIQPWNL